MWTARKTPSHPSESTDDDWRVRRERKEYREAMKQQPEVKKEHFRNTHESHRNGIGTYVIGLP